MVTKRTVKGSVFNVAKGSNFVSFDIRIGVNDISQMLHNIHDAVAELGFEVRVFRIETYIESLYLSWRLVQRSR